MKSKNTCSHCHKDLDGDGLTLWLDNERRLQSAPLGDPPDHRIEALSSPVPVCTACNESYQAIRKIEKAMKKDARHLAPRRLGGHLVRALDHRCQLVDDPAEYSRVEVDVYDPGPAYGAWGFGYFPKEDSVRIEHHKPPLFTRSGQLRELATDQTFEVAADLWRLNAVGVAALFVGVEIAVTAGPMLQMPPRDEILKQRKKLRKRLREQDAGIRERSLDFVGHCWLEGAISLEEHDDYWARWQAEESLDEPLGDGEEYFSEDEEIVPHRIRRRVPASDSSS